ncbi:mutator type transposase [Tanacetum coccineum]
MDKRVCSCRKWELTRITCKHVMAAIYNMSENSMGVGIPEHWVHVAYRLETWAHVYSFKVNPCNVREMWPVFESTTVIIPPLYKPQVGRPPKKRKKKGCRGQGGTSQAGGSSQADARQVAGSRNVSSQAGARQVVGARNISGQAAGARNASSQAGGSSQPSASQSTSTGARNASSQAAGASQPSATPSTTCQ